MFLTNNRLMILSQYEFHWFPGRVTTTMQTLLCLTALLKETGLTGDSTRDSRPRSSRSNEENAAEAASAEAWRNWECKISWLSFVNWYQFRRAHIISFWTFFDVIGQSFLSLSPLTTQALDYTKSIKILNLEKLLSPAGVSAEFFHHFFSPSSSPIERIGSVLLQYNTFVIQLA